MLGKLRAAGAALLVVVLFALAAGTAQAFIFSDPANLYSTSIADSWVYQAYHSTPEIAVFYGEGDYDLLYFETLGSVLDNSAEDLAKRSLELYSTAGGLRDFQLEMPLIQVEVADQKGLACAYTYQDERGNKLWEYRVFLLLPEGRGFSIALSSDGPWVKNRPPVLEEVLAKWQWML